MRRDKTPGVEAPKASYWKAWEDWYEVGPLGGGVFDLFLGVCTTIIVAGALIQWFANTELATIWLLP